MGVRSKATKESVKRLPLSVLVKRAERSGANTEFKATHDDAVIVWTALNHAVFGGILVMPEKFIVQDRKNWDFWGECEGWQRGSRWGEHYTKCIRIQKVQPNAKRFIDVMAHEMVHQYEWEQQGVMTHGQKTFFVWRDKLAEKGIPLTVVFR